MSLIAFASAKGSPGVSRIVGAATGLWGNGAVFADLDPAGGDALMLQHAPDGNPLSSESGLVSFGASLRGGKSADLNHHLQDSDEGYRVLAGVSTPVQVHALGPVWPSVARQLKNFNSDVLADVGRFELGSPAQPVLEEADAVVFVARDDVASLGHLRERLTTLREPLSMGRRGGTPVGIVLVGDPRNDRAAADVVRLFASSGTPVTGLGTIARDPKTAASWERISDRARRRSVFYRSLVDVNERIRAMTNGAGRQPTVESNVAERS